MFPLLLGYFHQTDTHTEGEGEGAEEEDAGFSDFCFGGLRRVSECAPSLRKGSGGWKRSGKHPLVPRAPRPFLRALLRGRLGALGAAVS